MSERLTANDINSYQSINPIDLCFDEYSYINFSKMLNKLGEYEDLEEQGLLLRLPCKIGSTIYVIKKLCDDETMVIVEVTVRNFDIRALQKFVIDIDGHRLNFLSFGKVAFFTREEAEERLKKLQSEKRLPGEEILIDNISKYELEKKMGLLVQLPIPLGATIYTVIYAPEVNAGYISENKMTLKYYADNIKLFNAGCVHTEPTKADAMLTELKMQRMRCDDEDL